MPGQWPAVVTSWNLGTQMADAGHFGQSAVHPRKETSPHVQRVDSLCPAHGKQALRFLFALGDMVAQGGGSKRAFVRQFRAELSCALVRGQMTCELVFCDQIPSL